jgi:hypothetical protein
MRYGTIPQTPATTSLALASKSSSARPRSAPACARRWSRSSMRRRASSAGAATVSNCASVIPPNVLSGAGVRHAFSIPSIFSRRGSRIAVRSPRTVTAPPGGWPRRPSPSSSPSACPACGGWRSGSRAAAWPESRAPARSGRGGSAAGCSGSRAWRSPSR